MEKLKELLDWCEEEAEQCLHRLSPHVKNSERMIGKNDGRHDAFIEMIEQIKKMTKE